MFLQYCSTRADPNVAQSPYLNTLGAGLDPEIGIFWTGSKVVSEVITKDEIVALSQVLLLTPKPKAILLRLWPWIEFRPLLSSSNTAKWTAF